MPEEYGGIFPEEKLILCRLWSDSKSDFFKEPSLLWQSASVQACTSTGLTERAINCRNLTSTEK